MLTLNSILQNRYQIIRLLGQGGMGAVYLAFDQRLNQHVALKENTGGDPRQFQQEAQLLARLRHPNLPRVGDHFVEPNGTQYLVMDYIAGEDLETLRQARGALPEAQVRVWFDQIFDAVAYLHSQRVIHRDIKPDNIKITPGGQAVLVDFGIAKVYQTGQFTRTGQKFGSPGYASPEHYHGGTNQQSDIYSLGATLYAALTGGPPPDAQALELGSALLVPPTKLNPAISPQMEQVILRAMQRKQAARWHSIGELRSALTQPLPTFPLPRRSGYQSKTLLLALGSASVLFILLVGSILLWAFNGQSADSTPTQLAARSKSTFTPKPLSTRTPLPSHTLTPMSTVTPQPASSNTPIPSPINTTSSPTSSRAPTSAPSHEPSSSPVIDPTNTSVLPEISSSTVSPTETPTLPAIASGVYVTQIDIIPTKPKSRERFHFDVEFLNTFSQMQTVLWRILVSRENRMIAVVSEQGHDVAVGKSTLTSATLDINVNGCENFIAVPYDDTSLQFSSIPNIDGSVFRLEFEVCP